mmetsp:Transcript_16160/g.19360  ORF Transcript_16160/g.19360 Transcript_16160/m.19360 type:complete len:81 (+) Transcript_16160:1232-1474(+)
MRLSYRPSLGNGHTRTHAHTHTHTHTHTQASTDSMRRKYDRCKYKYLVFVASILHSSKHTTTNEERKREVVLIMLIGLKT